MEDVPNEVEADNNGKFYRDSNGKFLPGNPGRPPGSVNHARKAIRDFVNIQSENLPQWFASLENDRERLEYYIRMLPYAIPRLASVEMTPEETPKSMIDFTKLSESALKEVLANTITNE